ncbi:MAG: O-antigen ligase family protein [Verrucomicrobia bacterium]|nr:O-antigen ligase family protein [Verrucomicrobiota bacterium]
MNPENRAPAKFIFGLALLVILSLPWLLGGQLIEAQLVALALASVTLLISLRHGTSTLKVPIGLTAGIIIYVLVQYANPALAQDWQTGLRIWIVSPLDPVPWLPSSILTDIGEASPIRFLILITPAVFVGLTVFRTMDVAVRPRLLSWISANGALIALVGLFQLKLESPSILGLFNAVDEVLGLFFATFLYKNHAAAFFNLAMATSLACFFCVGRNNSFERSNPRALYLTAAALLLLGVIFSRSRFGFICSLLVLAMFVPLALKRIRRSNFPRKWVMVIGSILSVLVIGGGTFLLRSKSAKHLQTLNAQITEDFSFKQRQLAYRSEFRMLASKPIYGWGAGNFRHGFRQFQDTDAEREKIRIPYMERHQLNFFWQHAHNDYLEWLIELGIVGTLLLFSIPGYFFRAIFKSRRWKEPVPLMLLAGLGSTMVHALIDFPFRNPAVLMAWFVILVVTARLCEPKESRNS